MAGNRQEVTKVGDLPEVCLAHAIALTSPRDACRCAAVSPAFRAAADSDHVWRRFLLQGPAVTNKSTASKDAYLRLCDTGAVLVDGEGNAMVIIHHTNERPHRRRRLQLPFTSFPWLIDHTFTRTC